MKRFDADDQAYQKETRGVVPVETTSHAAAYPCDVGNLVEQVHRTSDAIHVQTAVHLSWMDRWRVALTGRVNHTHVIRVGVADCGGSTVEVCQAEVPKVRWLVRALWRRITRHVERPMTKGGQS